MRNNQEQENELSILGKAIDHLYVILKDMNANQEELVNQLSASGIRTKPRKRERQGD